MTIDAYLEALRRRLPGPRGARRELLRELGDGLRDAASIYQVQGMSRQEAERRAVAEAGDPDQLAPEYSETLAVTQGRRTAMLYALGSPASVLAWGMVWSLPGAVSTQASGYHSPVALLCWQLIDYSGFAAAVASVCALGMLVLSSRKGWSRRTVLLLPALVGIGNVAVTAVCSTIGNLAVEGDGAFDIGMGLPPSLSLLGVASLMVASWQAVSSWRTIRSVRAVRTPGSSPPPPARHPAAV